MRLVGRWSTKPPDRQRPVQDLSDDEDSDDGDDIELQTQG